MSEEAGVFGGTVSLFSVLSTAEKAQQNTIPESADTKGHAEHSYMDSESLVVDFTAAVNKLKSQEQWDRANLDIFIFPRGPDVRRQTDPCNSRRIREIKGFRVEEISVEE